MTTPALKKFPSPPPPMDISCIPDDYIMSIPIGMNDISNRVTVSVNTSRIYIPGDVLTPISSGQVSPVGEGHDSGLSSDGTSPLVVHKNVSKVVSDTPSDTESEGNVSNDSLGVQRGPAIPKTLLEDIKRAKNDNPPSQNHQKLLSVSQGEGCVTVTSWGDEKDDIVPELPPRSEDFHFKFHVNEKNPLAPCPEDETGFAGKKNLYEKTEIDSTIRSSNGTVRGFKNRVRAGIATFLQQNSPVKVYSEREAGKVVVYTTSLTVIRGTYQKCLQVHRILRTLMIRYEERDVFMSRDTQLELKERLGSSTIMVPQIFVEGELLGGADQLEKLNETGQLRHMLRPYKHDQVPAVCEKCGGYRHLPCNICNGSKKSVLRNGMCSEFVSLKCRHCDESGLIRCDLCLENG